MWKRLTGIANYHSAMHTIFALCECSVNSLARLAQCAVSYCAQHFFSSVTIEPELGLLGLLFYQKTLLLHKKISKNAKYCYISS